MSRCEPGCGHVKVHRGAAAEASVAGAVDGYAGRESRAHEWVGAAHAAYLDAYAYYSRTGADGTQQLAAF